MQRRENQTGYVVDLQRSGRPYKTTAAEDGLIRTTRLRERFKSASSTARNLRGNQPISYKTVIRRLAKNGLNCS